MIQPINTDLCIQMTLFSVVPNAALTPAETFVYSYAPLLPSRYL